MKRLITSLICFLGTGCANADYLLPIEDVENIFRYTGNDLSITDTKDDASASDPNTSYIQSYEITSSNRTFAPMSVFVTSEGQLLTEDLDERLKATFVDAAKNDYSSVVTRFGNQGERRGYKYLGGFGPGGALERFVATNPALGIDIMFSVAIPGDPPLNLEGYPEYKKIIENPDARSGLSDAFQRFLVVAEKRYESINLGSEKDSKSFREVSAGAELPDIRKSNQLPLEESSQSKRFFWGVIFTILIAMGFFLMFTTKRKK